MEAVLATQAARDAVVVSFGPRPYEIPAAIETLSAPPIAMPKAPLHTLRVLAVRPADDRLMRLV
jgi:hypothetical protein